MSRKPSHKPQPKPSPTVAVANKSKAAIGQLDSAILLWFMERDPISILVLASNAHDCYHALGKKMGKPSVMQQALERIPLSFQERHRYIQDFAKHGFKDLDENVPFEPAIAEAVMTLSVDCHRQIIGKLTPLMALFWLRIFHEHPSFVKREQFPKEVQDSGLLDQAGHGSRKQCLERFKPFLIQLGDAL
jgi:hypothetical protein